MLNLAYCYWREFRTNRQHISKVKLSQSRPEGTIRCVALGESLVFNVASQKNAISDGFCPFIVGSRSVAQPLRPGDGVGQTKNETAGFARRACSLKL